jgi:N-acetylmuramoyl-L-alanine amidase.
MRGLSLCANLPFTVPSIEDITDKLPRKATWETLKKKWTVKGVWDGRTYCVGLRTTDQIDTIIVHHSGSPEGTLASHATYHASKWGAGIAYHVAIDKGRIYQTNDLLSMTYHAANNNTYTVGIVVNRDLTKADLTDEERQLLYAAILSVKSAIPTIKYILGHNEVCATQCPATSMKRIREDIAELELHIAEHQTYTESIPANMVEAFAVGKRTEALWANYNTEKWKPAAEAKFMMLAEVTGCETVQAIYERIMDLYKKAQAGQWQGEAIRKLLLISAVMKERGIL